MIKLLSIRNFGSNQKIDIKLDQHITCITGESYTGKSWILRALKHASLNKPSGIRHIRWGSKRSSVRVKVGQNTITRERSKSINTYHINGQKMEAFGSNVPDPVSQLLKLSSLNFQTQQEMPPGEGPLFWFALTPGQVSKRLNEIVNLDLIDRILSNLQSEVRTAKTTLDVCRDRRKEAHQKVKETSFVEELKEEWEDVLLSIEKEEAWKEKHSKLKYVLADVAKQESILFKMRRDTEKADSDLQELEEAYDSIVETEGKIQELDNVISEIEDNEIFVTQTKKELKEAEQQYQKAFGKRCPLCNTKIR